MSSENNQNQTGENRKSVICLFDVDGTLTDPRQRITPEMEKFMENLRKHVTVGLVGGSDLVKILEQLGGDHALNNYDYVFSENGLVAHKDGKLIFQEKLNYDESKLQFAFSIKISNKSFYKRRKDGAKILILIYLMQNKVQYVHKKFKVQDSYRSSDIKKSVVRYMGEEKLQKFINFCFKYMSDLWLPFKRGTFIETRSGLINVAPPGRSCTQPERNQFESYDKEHKIREKFIEALKQNFPDYDFVYSIGGQISFDVFPAGWDKRFCLTQIVGDGFEKIYFFGDKTFKGGNDYEIANDPRTVAFTVTSPENTRKIVADLLSL